MIVLKEDLISEEPVEYSPRISSSCGCSGGCGSVISEYRKKDNAFDNGLIQITSFAWEISYDGIVEEKEACGDISNFNGVIKYNHCACVEDIGYTFRCQLSEESCEQYEGCIANYGQQFYVSIIVGKFKKETIDLNLECFPEATAEILVPDTSPDAKCEYWFLLHYIAVFGTDTVIVNSPNPFGPISPSGLFGTHSISSKVYSSTYHYVYNEETEETTLECLPEYSGQSTLSATITIS